MTWDDIEMMNFRQTTDGNWSFTAYRKPFAMWRSNKGLPDVFACIEQIQAELVLETKAEEEAAKAMAKGVAGNAASKRKSSGGMGSEPAGKPAQIEPVRGELNDPPMVLKVSSRRRPRKRR
ncbi:MAG: hypothetical protein E6Q97_17795 [Desulfurellales bacterium]|nr:MAG: hypothetical protein E6Q97_17795 [Desulfurellales bacterium]